MALSTIRGVMRCRGRITRAKPGDLLEAGDHPTQSRSDPTAAKVLSRGEVLAAPTGRADDFSWPRGGSDASATPEVSPEPVALAPGTAGKTGVKVQDQADTKK